MALTPSVREPLPPLPDTGIPRLSVLCKTTFACLPFDLVALCSAQGDKNEDCDFVQVTKLRTHLFRTTLVNYFCSDTWMSTADSSAHCWSNSFLFQHTHTLTPGKMLTGISRVKCLLLILGMKSNFRKPAPKFLMAFPHLSLICEAHRRL